MTRTEPLYHASGCYILALFVLPLICANLDSTTMSTSAPTLSEGDPTAQPTADLLSNAVTAAGASAPVAYVEGENNNRS